MKARRKSERAPCYWPASSRGTHPVTTIAERIQKLHQDHFACDHLIPSIAPGSIHGLDGRAQHRYRTHVVFSYNFVADAHQSADSLGCCTGAWQSIRQDSYIYPIRIGPHALPALGGRFLGWLSQASSRILMSIRGPRSAPGLFGTRPALPFVARNSLGTAAVEIRCTDRRCTQDRSPACTADTETL